MNVSWICGNLSPGGRLVLAGSSDGTIRLWETTSGREIWNINAHKDGVNDVVFSSTGRLIISTGNDNRIRIMTTDDGKIVDNIDLSTSKDNGRSVAFFPDRMSFLVGSTRGVILHFAIDEKRGYPALQKKG
ncbi:MAG: hypothetical protein SVY10_21525 [Thermodesulfobacteriota bacterium]|nr:hypothetical protein [Thermodesulfobacteriota bacterium]